MFIATLSINKRHLKCLVSGLKLKDLCLCKAMI